MTFFKLQTPRDMLEKANREYARLCDSFDIDNVFNYFVTAYHISDYIKKTKAVEQSTLSKFLEDPDIKMSRDLCDKGKHMTLTHRPDPKTKIITGGWGTGPWGLAPWGGGESWSLVTNDQNINIKQLSKIVLEKWTSFFQNNGL